MLPDRLLSSGPFGSALSFDILPASSPPPASRSHPGLSALRCLSTKHKDMHLPPNIESSGPFGSALSFDEEIATVPSNG